MSAKATAKAHEKAAGYAAKVQRTADTIVQCIDDIYYDAVGDDRIGGADVKTAKQMRKRAAKNAACIARCLKTIREQEPGLLQVLSDLDMHFAACCNSAKTSAT